MRIIYFEGGVVSCSHFISSTKTSALEAGTTDLTMRGSEKVCTRSLYPSTSVLSKSGTP